MKLSTEYKNLKKQLDILKKGFMDFPDAESLSLDNQNKLRAFTVLSHAEFEHYFESVAQVCFDYGKELWKKENKIHPILLNIILFSGETFSGKWAMGTPQKMIDERVCSAFQTVIDKNHGIKEENILKLFVPLGIRMSNFDTAWLSTISSYGTKRGSIAHKSCSVIHALYGPDLTSNIKAILAGIRLLDRKVQKLKTSKKHPLVLKY